MAVSEDAEKQYGPKGNFRRALWMLIAADPHAEWYMVCQDDIRMAKGTREWLEANLWPDTGNIGVVSLYCPLPNHPNRPGWFQYPLTSHQAVSRCYGACAYLMPNAAAKRFLADNPRPNQNNLTDLTMGWWCYTTGNGYWSHSPSLVEHIGVCSSVRSGGLDPYREARIFVEDASVCNSGIAGVPARAEHGKDHRTSTDQAVHL